MAKPSVNGRPSEAVAASSVGHAEEKEQDLTLPPELVKKFSRPGEVERACRDMR